MKTFRTAYIFLTAVAIGFIDIATVGVAHGTTPDAWAAHAKEVVSACAAASNLRDAKPGGNIVDFDDRAGFTAVVIDGRYPQPHMKNKRGRVLCLFDKRTRTPFVSDADSMLRKREP
ncbi:MAG: hypothetical protein ACREVP_04970 [Burkholderiales bacterium]